MTGILDALACVGDPVGCGIGWVGSLPVLGVIAASIALGMLAGAHMGKVAVYAVLTLGAGLLFLNRKQPDDEHEMVTHHPDKRPQPTRKPKPVNWQDGEIPRRKTAMERWIEGDQQ